VPQLWALQLGEELRGVEKMDTTHRYAEINMRSKEAALQACEPPVAASAAFPRRPVWRDDAALLNWLSSL
jgi:integrase/recombinase XerD